MLSAMETTELHSYDRLSSASAFGAWFCFLCGASVLLATGRDASSEAGTCQVEWEDPLIRMARVEGRRSDACNCGPALALSGLRAQLLTARITIGAGGQQVGLGCLTST